MGKYDLFDESLSYFKELLAKTKALEKELNDVAGYVLCSLSDIFREYPRREFVFVCGPGEMISDCSTTVSFLFNEEKPVPAGFEMQRTGRKIITWYHHLGYINRIYSDSEQEVRVEIVATDFSEQASKHFDIPAANLPHHSIFQILSFLLDDKHLLVRDL